MHHVGPTIVRVLSDHLQKPAVAPRRAGMRTKRRRRGLADPEEAGR